MKERSGFLRHGLRTQSEIDESGARHGWRLGNVADVELRHNFCSNVAWFFTALFRKYQGRVCLVIAKTRIGCLRQLTGIRQPGFRERIAQPLREN